MSDLIGLLKNKAVHICFLPSSYAGGGTAAAEYTVKGCVDGFMVLEDNRHRTIFCRLDQIGKITVVPEASENKGDRQ